MIASRPTRSISATIASIRRMACSVCDRMTTSNAASWKRQAALEVALKHVDAVAHTRQHARIVDLDTVSVGVPLLGEKGQQRTVAAPQVQYPRAVGDPVADRCVVGTRDAVGARRFSSRNRGQRCTSDRHCCGLHTVRSGNTSLTPISDDAARSGNTSLTPISDAMRSNHARTTAWYCGLSSRNASCPCGAAISAYETSRRSRTNALTISRERDAGKRQSVVNEMTRNLHVAGASARANRHRCVSPDRNNERLRHASRYWCVISANFSP